jgi:outer membrane protein OmpA-like peptidoglycan-associated protein
MEGQWDSGAPTLVTEKTNLVTFDLDWLYYITPCEAISPYIFAGAGGNYKTIDYAQTAIPENDRLGLQLNAGVGVEAKLAPEWNLVTEFGYYSTVNSSLDGSIVPSEINGRDSYFVVSAGVNYIFGEGKTSELCAACASSAAMNGFDEKNAAKKPLIDDYLIQVTDDRLLMVGVNFDYAKSRLLQESYEVLDKAVKLLIARPGLKIEIEGYGEGYTEKTETGASNLKLSLDRAQAIKDYFVAKGIAAARLTITGYGMKSPFGDNKTLEARAMNKRILLRIIK